jgi:ferritin-like metal-binding protein YciE
MSLPCGCVSIFRRRSKFGACRRKVRNPTASRTFDRAGRDEPDSAAGSEAPPPKSQHSKSDGKAKAMGIFSKDIKTLDDLFVHTLRDIYYAEQQIEKVLPKMIDKATDPQLKAGFEKHLGQTKGHIQRVEEVFELHGIKAKAVNCPAIDGILEEADEVGGHIADKEVLDAALISSAQAVEHYEITRYGSLIAWAKQLGRSDCANVLANNLKEEVATDRKLTEMAESKINLQAAE